MFAHRTKPKFDVSSHAPVRGHHAGRVGELAAIVVSSHAPVRGHPLSLTGDQWLKLFQVMPP